MLWVQPSGTPETFKSYRATQFNDWWTAYDAARIARDLPAADYGTAQDAFQLGESPERAADFAVGCAAKVSTPTPPAHPRTKRICAHCKGANVKVDAWAAWDVGAQAWTVEETFQNGHCDDCDGEATVIEEPL